MDFKTDIFSLVAPINKKFALDGMKLPINKDIYFRAKQKEVLDQYAAARIFMHETETDDWGHWFDKVEDVNTNRAFETIFISYFYEAALIYYNIVVDLSWVITYVAAEFACLQKGERIDFFGMKSIEEATAFLRNAENNVRAPTAGTNPFGYLKKMNPEFSEIIDLVIEFWEKFCLTSIRQKYNYCKHKGKPAYSEIEKLRDGKMVNIYINKKAIGKKIQIASDIGDVQYHFSLIEGIRELYKFDDEVLFPYIKVLFNKLEQVIQPSPIV